MSNLTCDQLSELTALVNSRRAEFGEGMFAELTLGEVRTAYDVIVQWWQDRTFTELQRTVQELEQTPLQLAAIPAPAVPLVARHLPTLEEVITELRRQAVRGLMPTMSAFNQELTGQLLDFRRAFEAAGIELD